MKFLNRLVAELHCNNDYMIDVDTQQQPKGQQIVIHNITSQDVFPRHVGEARAYEIARSSNNEYVFGVIVYDRSSYRNIYYAIFTSTYFDTIDASEAYALATSYLNKGSYNEYLFGKVTVLFGTIDISYTSSPRYCTMFMAKSTAGNRNGYSFYLNIASSETGFTGIDYSEDIPFWTTNPLTKGTYVNNSNTVYLSDMFIPSLYSLVRTSGDIDYYMNDASWSITKAVYDSAVVSIEAFDVVEPPKPEPPEGGDGSINTDYGYNDSYGGEGDGYVETEDLPFDTLPTLDYGRLFLLTTPTTAQLSALIDWLSSSSLPDIISRMFVKPLNAIISVLALPISLVEDTLNGTLYIGETSTQLSMNYITKGYVSRDLGDPLYIEAPTGTYLDFESQVSVYLPFVGEVHLNPIEVIGKYIKVVYHIDVVTGSFVTFIYIAKTVDKLNQELCDNMCMYTGQMGQNIPITAENHNSIITGIGGMLASGGGAIGGAVGLTMGSNPVTAGLAIMAGVGGLVTSAGSMAKQNYDTVGTLSSSNAMLTRQTGYVKLTYPRVNLNSVEFPSQYGYSSHQYKKLSDLTGFVKVENIHLEGVNAMSDELDEIITLLKEGVTI